MMKAMVRTNYFRAAMVLVAVATAAILLVALGVSAAQATTTPSQTIPSGTEVIPYISYDSNSGTYSIKLYDPAKHNSETISSTEGTDSYLSQPRLSEDGRKVLFVEQGSIGFIPSNGGERTPIVTSGRIGSYDLSQDGSKVLYGNYNMDDPNNPTIHLFTAPVESNASPTDLGPLPSGFSELSSTPIFNKEGTGIFFTGFDRNDPSLTAIQIYYMNLDGTGVTKLTDFTAVYNPDSTVGVQPAGYYPQGLELSPDGNTIVYYGFRATDGNNVDTAIFTLPVSGGTPKEVAAFSSGRRGTIFSPHYNHDGSKIMYWQARYMESDRSRVPPKGYDILAISAHGTNGQMLVEGGLEDSGNWEIVNK